MILAHKQAFLRLLTVTSREAQAQDPETLGRQLAVLFADATALVTSIDDIAPFDDARPVAAALIDQAIPPADEPNHDRNASASQDAAPGTAAPLVS